MIYAIYSFKTQHQVLLTYRTQTIFQKNCPVFLLRKEKQACEVNFQEFQEW